MKKDEIEEYATFAIAFVAAIVPTLGIFWLIYKIASGAFYLLDKLIDKL